MIFPRQVDGRSAQRLAVGPTRGRGGRRDMIEKPVILVEHHEQGGARPDFGIGGQCVEDFGGIGRALCRAGGPGCSDPAAVAMI